MLEAFTQLLEKILEFYRSGDYSMALLAGGVFALVYMKKFYDFTESVKWKHLRQCKEALEGDFLEKALKLNIRREYNIAAFSNVYGIGAYSMSQVLEYLYVIENIESASGRILLGRSGFAVSYENGRMKVSYGWKEAGMKWFSWFSAAFMGIASVVACIAFVRSLHTAPEWSMLYTAIAGAVVFSMYIYIAVMLLAVEKLSKEVERIYRKADENEPCCTYKMVLPGGVMTANPTITT